MTLRAGLTVVVPNFNGARLLRSCFDALAAQTVRPAAVIVVDNGSTDGSADLVAQLAPAAQVIRFARNRGFGAAANAGVAAAETELVAVLNSDARPAPDWAELMLSFDRPDAWSWGAVLLDREGLVESAGDCYSLHGHSFKAMRGMSPELLPTEPYEVFAVPGAAVVVRREAFLSLGGFDEGFFLYYEDIDLAFRARGAGLTSWVVPAARVEHDLAGSSSRRRATYFIARNGVSCYLRNVPRLQLGHWLRTIGRELAVARRDGCGGPYVRGLVVAVPRVPAALVARRHRSRQRRVARADLAAMCVLQPPVPASRGGVP